MSTTWFKRFAFVALIALTCSSVASAREAAPAATPVSLSSIDPSAFGRPITNPYFPLAPGTVFIYEGTSDDAMTRDEMTVTAETRTILGVECIVVHDVAFEEGEMVEETFDWYTQDAEGNVWYFGEDSTSYEDGKPQSTAGSWEAGVDGASPGIVMPAHPAVGDGYYQEYYRGEAEDQAEILSLDDALTTSYGSFTDVLTTKEWSELEPEIVEHKSYAKGVGLILAVSVQGESERSELIEVRTVN
jgi:hypothetical protein